MSNTVNKSDLITKMAKEASLNKHQSKISLNAILDTVTDALSKKEGVRLVGFGSFKVNHRKARKGRNPQTGKSLTISARNVPSFKAGKSLKTKVNK